MAILVYIKQWFVPVIISLIGVILLLGCSRVVYTDRNRTLLISESQLAEMGKQSYQQLLASVNISTKAGQTAVMKRVGVRLTTAVEQSLKELGMADRIPLFQWEFSLIDDDQTVNAFCLPGGKVAVYSGIFQVATNDAQLAVVIGHEIAHAVAQHGNERMSQQMAVEFGAGLMDKVLETHSERSKQIFNTVYGVGTTVGVLLPYSRVHEIEADKIGLILMAKAGYAPDAALEFWKGMKILSEGKQQPEIISTHPSDEHRIADIQAFLPEARKYYISSGQ